MTIHVRFANHKIYVDTFVRCRADLASDTEEEEERQLEDYTSKTGQVEDRRKLDKILVVMKKYETDETWAVHHQS